VGDVIMGVGLHISGRGYQALITNAKNQFFYSCFYWKLGYKKSL